VRSAEAGIYQAGIVKVSAFELRALELDALQESAGGIYAHQRNVVRIQFLESFDPAAAAALALRRVDELPRRVVFLLLAVARLREIEDHREQHGENAQVLQDFQQGPSAQIIGGPLPAPFQRAEGQRDGHAILFVLGPGMRPRFCSMMRRETAAMSARACSKLRSGLMRAMARRPWLHPISTIMTATSSESSTPSTVNMESHH
jgi:hypothetical protein